MMPADEDLAVVIQSSMLMSSTPVQDAGDVKIEPELAKLVAQTRNFLTQYTNNYQLIHC